MVIGDTEGMAVDNFTMEKFVADAAPVIDDTIFDSPGGEEPKLADIGVEGAIADDIAADGVRVDDGDTGGVTTSSSCLHDDTINYETTAEKKVSLTCI